MSILEGRNDGHKKPKNKVKLKDKMIDNGINKK